MLITRGNYKMTQTIMLIACVFFLAYIFSAFKAKPDWGLALSNLIYPHGVEFTPTYIKRVPDHRHGRAGHDHHSLGPVLYQQLCL